MTTLIGPRGGPVAPVDTDLPGSDWPVADGLCDFSKLTNVDLSGADLDLFPGDPRPRGDIRVVAAMSGGVDSSVVAALLKYAGYDVIGVTLQLYDHGAALKKQGACCAGQDIHDARRVAEALGIPHYVLDYESRFRQQVMEDFADTYLKGSTPIPCVRCNQTVKFSDLLATARDLGADAMATGHYIRRTLDERGQAELSQAADPDRDQSYFLFATTRAQLDFLRFPLGGDEEAGCAAGGGGAWSAGGGKARQPGYLLRAGGQVFRHRDEVAPRGVCAGRDRAHGWPRDGPA